MPNSNPIAARERKAILPLAGIFAFRMLGLFMILPVFSLYTHQLVGATPTLIGFALGIYGLTQAVFQIPLGMWSDKMGRKPIIALGLLVFVCGSMVAAMATTIHGIIIGRALQGAGAVGSTIIALVADLTTVENRTKSMAIIGMTIGLSFTLAMVLGPLLNTWIQLSGIFWLTAALGIVGIALLFMGVPTPPRLVFHRDAEPLPALFKTVLRNRKLLWLDMGILFLHAILTATFIAIPIAIDKMAGLNEARQWELFLPVLVLSFIVMFPLIIVAEKGRKMRPVFLSCIAMLILSLFSLVFFHTQVVSIGVLLFLFFIAFTVLEAILPSLVSKVAPASSKGTAMGVYSTSQFFGIFVGGTIGGLLLAHFGIKSVFFFASLLSLVWLILTWRIQFPPHLSSLMVSIPGPMSDERSRFLTQALSNTAGVAEAAIIPEEGIAYLKVDNKIVDKAQLERLMSELD